MIQLGSPMSFHTKPNVEVIGITGRMRSGKNVVADMLVEILKERQPKGYFSNYDIKVYAFADPLKECLINTFGLSRESLYTQQGKASMNYHWGMTHRQILQKFGTEAVRNNLHNDAWVFAMDNYIDNFENNTVLIIPDVRFENEARLCRNYGHILNIERPAIVTKMMKFKEKFHLVHKSEQPLSSQFIDYTIVNDSTLGELKSKVRMFVGWLTH